MDAREREKRRQTFAVMVVTGFFTLLGVVGWLSLEFGNDVGRTVGIVLGFIPLMLVGVSGLYLLWRLDLMSALATLKRAIDWFTARWQRDAAPVAPVAPPRRVRRGPSSPSTALAGDALPVAVASAPPASSPASEPTLLVQVGPGQHRRLTAAELRAEVQRLWPLAAQATQHQRAAQQAQADTQRLNQQLEGEQQRREEWATELAAQQVEEWLAAWYGALFVGTDVPAPEQALAAVSEQIEQLQGAIVQVGELEQRLTAQAQTLATVTGERASLQQQLNTVRQRLDATHRALALSDTMPLVEGARQVQQQLVTAEQAHAQALSEAATWRGRAGTAEAALGRLEQQVRALEGQITHAAGEEVSGAALAAFWQTVNYGTETISDRWIRRLEQRFNAVGLRLVRGRTEARTELTELAEGGDPVPGSPTPTVLQSLGAPVQRVSPDKPLAESGVGEQARGSVRTMGRVRFGGRGRGPRRVRPVR